MTQYMLDTNIVSHLVKQHPIVVQRVKRLPVRSLCVSAITEGELLFGLAKRPNAKSLHKVVMELLKCVDVLPWDSEVAACYGVVRARQATSGKTLAPLDLLIATHAMSVGATLVTCDQAFEQVRGLVLENWLA